MACPLFDLSGRVALVTGGSKGLGRAMARGFAEAGAKIVISSRNETELKKSAVEIAKGLDTEVRYVVADMNQRNEVLWLAREAEAFFGKIDILVNNAGSNTPQPIAEIQDSDWDRLVELNLTSCMALTRALVPAMQKRKWGRIIMISSIMAYVSAPGRAVYSSTKAALTGMVMALSAELAKDNVTANCLAPGPFMTDLPMRVFSDEQKKVFSDRTAAKRWGDPRELAGPALLLASDAGSYINGTTLVVDGGLLTLAF